MKTEICPARAEERELLNNLLEKYNYEFSQYDMAAFDDNGMFGYTWLGCYFDGTPRRYAYIVRCDGRVAGFALINDHPERKDMPCDFAVAEFFIAYPYRRRGAGTEVMHRIFESHRGSWQIKYHPKNKASVCFWDGIAGANAAGGFVKLRGDEDYGDGSESVVLCFANE